MDEVKRKLIEIVGSDYVYDSPAELMPYSRDFNIYMIYREITGENLGEWIVVQPGSVKELVEILDYAYRKGIRVSVFGGGTGVLMSYMPDRSIVIDLARIDFIKWYDKDSNILHVGAGALLIDVENFLNKEGYTTGHYPQSIHKASIGGLISTGSIGMYSSGYGGIERHLLGLEVVIPGIGYINIEPSIRRNHPLPLDLLFISSEGLIGVIYSAYLKVYKKPDIKIRRLISIDSFEMGVEILKKLNEYRVEPTLIRLFDEVESTFYFNNPSPTILYELHGYSEAMDHIVGLDRVIQKLMDGKELSSSLADKWFWERYRYMEKLREGYKANIIIDTMEFSCPWSKTSTFYRDFKKKMLEISSVLYLSAHISHIHRTGCGIYYTIGIDMGKFLDDYGKIWDLAVKTAIDHRCSISHHHGIGRIRSRYLIYYYGKEVYKIFRKLVSVFDDKGILSWRIL